MQADHCALDDESLAKLPVERRHRVRNDLETCIAYLRNVECNWFVGVAAGVADSAKQIDPVFVFLIDQTEGKGDPDFLIEVRAGQIKQRSGVIFIEPTSHRIDDTMLKILVDFRYKEDNDAAIVFICSVGLKQEF